MIRRIILTMAFLASLSLSAKDVNMGSWQIVPLPQQVKEMSSAPFRITAKTTIYYAAGDEKQKKDAGFLASHIKEVTGIEVKTTDKQAKGQIRLALNAGDTQSEAYSLVVNKNGITISATWRLDYDRQLCSFYRINAALSGRYLSSPDTDIEKHDQAYQLWKFTLQQRFLDAVNLNFTVDNLFDYTPKKYYWSSAMTTGRTFSVGLSVDIDRIVNLF